MKLSYYLSLLLPTLVLALSVAAGVESFDILAGNDADHRGLIPGGYSLIEDLSDPRLETEASFVLSKLLESGQAPRDYSFYAKISQHNDNGVNAKVVKAMEQVVAGKNVRMILMLVDASAGDCLGAFAVTLYDHFGEFTVTEWNKETTCEHALNLLNRVGGDGR